MNDIQAPAPVDVVGRIISFRPTPCSDSLLGEVIKVWYDIKPHPKHYRVLETMIRVELPDGRQLNMRAEPDDIKNKRMVAENLYDNSW